MNVNIDEVIEKKKLEKKRNIWKAVQAFLILFIGIALWWNRTTLYQFIGDYITPSPVEWQGYTVHFSKDFSVITLDEKTLNIVSKVDPPASLYLFNYSGKPVSPKTRVESFCKLEDCFLFEERVVKVGDLEVMSAKAKYGKEDNANIIEFMNLPNTTITIEINTPIVNYESLRAMVNTIGESKGHST